MTIKSSFLTFAFSIILSACASPKTDVAWLGEMNNETDNASLSELTNIKNLYAVGPVSQLDGEITVIDGKCYIARVDQLGGEAVEEDCSLKAPFLVYGHFSKWNMVRSNVIVLSMKDLKRRIMEILSENGVFTEDPSVFLMEVDIEKLNYHIMKKGRVTPLMIHNKKVTLLGFYSKHHAGTFTHKGEQIHLHFLSVDKKHSGHVDDFKLRSNSKWKMIIPTRF